MSAAATTPLFKVSAVADSTSLISLPSLFTATRKPPHSSLSIPSKSLKFSLSSLSLPLKFKKSIHRLSPFTVWALPEEDNNTTITLDQQDEEGESSWENEESDGVEASLSDWDPEGEDATVEASDSQGEAGEDGLFEETQAEEESFVEPPEEAKLFVGNLPYDVDSQRLAMLFEKAGTVEIAEVIYNRETDRSRGFGFVTMSTVEEAEKAVEMFHRYDVDGRLLTVNKAAPRGTEPERPPRTYEPAFRIYVGNLPWDVDNARLEQVFSEHGKVVSARVVVDRESGRSRGFGFVTMATETELNDAIAALDGQSLDGRAIRVNVAEDKPPRRTF